MVAAGQGQAAPAAYPYPIVLKGPAALAGQTINTLAAYARQSDGKFRRIALQIDEVNKRGDYVLAGGIPYTARTDDGILDDNDELVVLGEQLGGDFSGEDVPKERRDAARNLWKVTFERAGRTVGYALIAAEKFVVSDQGTPQVRYDQNAHVVKTAAYTYEFHKRNPVLLGAVTLADGSPLIQSSKFLMPLRTPFFMPDLTFLDTDFHSQIECWQSGPIRSIVAVGVKYTSFLSLVNLHLFSELVFYREKFEIPTKIEFIFDPSTLLKPGSGLFYSLAFPPGRAWEIDSNLSPLPAKPADEVVEDGPKAAATEVFQARGHQQKEGSFLVSVRVDERARADVPPPFLVKKADFKDPARIVHWPWLERAPGDLGVFLDISQVRKGIYDFGLDLLLSPKADETFAEYGKVIASWQQLPATP